MICKCPNCNGAVEYNPSDEKLTCPYCGDAFQVQDVVKEQEEETMSQEMMSLNIYACTSCGAEISVNSTEVSTYCAYCGQPTIIFSRVSKERKPKYIIPFKVTKEQAVQKIRSKMRLGFFVPSEIKNFKVEMLRGIYVPYQLYNIYYYDHQTLQGEVKEQKRYFVREAECEFKGIPCDASMRLKDDLTQCLEPYDLRELKPFDPAYLSGFYADKASVGENSLRNVAMKRAKEMFDEQVKDSIKADKIQMCKGNRKCEVRNTDYVMLPVWFLMFRYKGDSYTMLVNGQTGKTVGTVPAEKKKLWIMFGILVPFMSLLGIGLCGLLKSWDAFELVLYYGWLVWLMLFGIGWGIFENVEKKIKRTRNRDMGMFVKKRQDKK